MTKLDLQYDLVNGTPASASPPQANFARTEQYVNQELINRDGSVAMNAQLRLIGDPLTALDATPKQYVDSYMPIGSIVMFGGGVTPPGGRWSLCDGSDVEQSVYPDLFAVIGTAYSPSGVTSGHFNLPNLTQRFPMGGGTPGVTGGSADGQVVAHTHSVDHAHPAGTTGNENVSHYHGGVDHLHGISLMTAGMDRAAVHSHWVRGIGTTSVSPGGFGEGNVADITNVSFGPAFNTNDVNTDHLHAVNGATQAADRSLNTGTESALHQHPFQTPTFNGASGPASNAAANANLPPYVTVNYIIRVR